jgi:glycosyltransferase involved in cell wall biosynthesis
LRILIATSNRNLIGGVEKYLQALFPALLDCGHSVALLYEYPHDAARETIDSPGARLPAWCSTALGTESVRREVSNWRPDVVYCHGLDELRLERALLEDYPAILFAHTYYGTCISGRKCHAVPRIEPCDRKLGAACLLLYYPRRCGGLNPGTMWRMFQEQSQRNTNLRDYRSILVASQHMLREYTRNGVDPNRLHLVPLPVIDGALEPIAARRTMPGGQILFVGRIMDVKGADHLIRAIPEAIRKLGRHLKVTIAGDGPDRNELEKLAQRLGVDADFTGWIGADRKRELMRQADLLAVPSLWPEPFGLAGLEAGCLGLPAVGYDVGGIREWLNPGESGELAAGDPPTVSGLAEAIARALADPEHYQKLCLGAWATARKHSIESHLAALEVSLAQVQAAAALPCFS